MTRSDFKNRLYQGKRWLYRKQWPNWIARIANVPDWGLTTTIQYGRTGHNSPSNS